MSVIRRAFSRHLKHWAESLEASDSNGRESEGAADAVLGEYVEGLPRPQNAIDCLPGWNAALPPQIDVKAGAATLYADPRILWAIEQFGSLKGRHVLELGPLEASHTYLLEQQEPISLTAIEANRMAFLRCLVVKELLGLKIARFHLGDFNAWLEQRDNLYDMIFASGVLYHMVDPVRLLELMARRASALYLWTHYADDEAMPPDDPRSSAFVGEAEVVRSHGVDVHVRKRSYWGAWRNKAFCGGMHDAHRWIYKEDILKLLAALGYDDIRIAHDQREHENGPSFSIFARRSGQSRPPDPS